MENVPTSPEEKISVSLERYLQLLRAERKLQCLEQHGVDNWVGYDWAMEELENMENSLDTE